MRNVDCDVFLFLYTVTMVIMAVTGGKGTPLRADRRRTHLRLLPEVLRAFETAPELQWIFYGVLMMGVLCFLPVRIVPAVRKGWQHLEHGGWRKATAALPAEGSGLSRPKLILSDNLRSALRPPSSSAPSTSSGKYARAASRSSWSSRTPSPRSSCPTARTSSNRGTSRCPVREPQLLSDPHVKQAYLDA